MSFDIVEHVCGLPYLVLATLFVHLPKSTAELYRNCHVPEIRDLARRRQWLEFAVRGSADLVAGYYEWSSFTARAEARLPFPYRVHTLEFAFLYFTHPTWGAWTDYIEHVDNLALRLDMLEKEYPFVEELRSYSVNLTSLTIDGGIDEYVQSHSLADLVLPGTLRLVKILDVHSHGYFGYFTGSYHGSYRELRVPESVREFLLSYLFATPEELPVLPARLRILKLTHMRVVLADAFVAVVPRQLAVLYLTWGNRNYPTVMLELAARGLPLLMYHHNLIVDPDPESYLYMRPGDVWQHVVLDHLDYSKYKSRQQIKQLHVTTENGFPPDNYLTHILREHPELERLSFKRVKAGCRVAPHLIAPSLTSVSIQECSTIADSTMQYAMNVTSLCLDCCSLRKVPAFIRLCTQLLSLDLRDNDLCVPEMDGREFPPTLTLLVMFDNSGKGTGEHAAGGMDLSHITRLAVLNLRKCRIERLDKIRLPDSLRELVVSQNKLDETVFGSVRLPPRLEELSLHLTEITNPWLLRLPDSLRALNLGELKLVDPPLKPLLNTAQSVRGFQSMVLSGREQHEEQAALLFPPGLETLSMQFSVIHDFSKYRLPLTLRQLDLRSSTFVESSEHVLPHGCVLLQLANASISARHAAPAKTHAGNGTWD